MRVGLDLGDAADIERARCADQLGLWAVTINASAGLETVRAARVVEQTQYVRIIVNVDLEADHPTTIAEEICVLDNLSCGRIVAVVSGESPPERLMQLSEALLGRPNNGVVVSPPPVQTEVPVWLTSPSTIEGPPVIARSAAELVAQPGRVSPGKVVLCGDLGADRVVMDSWRDVGCTHLLVAWPGSIKVLARHLVTRAATADFPEVVAEMADRFDPIASKQT